MVDHPKFVAHSDWRETFRLSEVDDDTCKLVVLTDDQLEILRRALKAARKRGNWIDSEDADGYMTPDDTDWDDTLALIDDLEWRLMSACDYVTLDDENERVGIGEATPEVALEIGTGTASNVELLRLNNSDTSGKGTRIQFNQGSTMAGTIAQTYYSGTDYTLHLGTMNALTTLSLNNGNVGIGKSPSYALDVDGAARIYGAFGCNSQVPQTAYAVPGNASDLSSAITLVNAIKAALMADGIVKG